MQTSESTLNLYQSDLTNQDLNIVYTPHDNIMHYEYTLYKDNEIVKTVEQNNNYQSNILLTESGIYQIRIKEFNYYNEVNELNSGRYLIDKDKPTIEVSSNFVELEKDQTLDLFSDLKAYDKWDGDLKTQVTTNINELDLTTTGTKELIYTVSDRAGNTATKTVTINVVDNYSNQLLFFQTGLILFLIVAIIIVLAYRRTLKLETRINKYAVQPLKDKSPSLFDNITKPYNKLVEKISTYINKSVFIQKYATRYEKYINTVGSSYQKGIDFVSNKFIISVFFLIVAIISKTIQLEVMSIYEICFPMIFGFFAPDLIYISKYRIHRTRIENDLLQAIIIMNNAFKSGRSITQAIELVTTELEGPIAEEFKKMYLEISFGLSIDVVFKRFSDRVKLEEVTYLTASLSILNKTGGNIIKVFSSIEKSLFNKKKLKLEMASLTGSSKLIVYVLFIVPILFIAFISILNPGYFLPFFTSDFGIILLIFMIIYYIIYVISVQKIMKVRM